MPGILDPTGTPEPERLADSLTADTLARGQLRSALIGLGATLVALIIFALFWQTRPGEALDEGGAPECGGVRPVMVGWRGRDGLRVISSPDWSCFHCSF